MSFKTILESTLDVYVAKKPAITICGFRPKQEVKKRWFAPAKVRLLETAGCGPLDQSVYGSKFLLQISFIAQNKKPLFISLADTVSLSRVSKPRHCLVISTEPKNLQVRLASESETECQRWTITLLNILSSFSGRRSERFSLCLSNYLVSIVDSKQAKACGLHGFEYWVVLDKEIGLTLFPAARCRMSKKNGEEAAASVSFPFEQIGHVGVAEVDNVVDTGNILEIAVSRTATKDEKRGNSLKRQRSERQSGQPKMTRRWRHKSPKKFPDEDGRVKQPLTPTASLGFHTLSLFCPDAQKFVDEWNSCQKANGQRPMLPADINGNRLSSTSNSSRSTSNSSHSNLSALNSLLRRSLPSLNSSILTPASTPSGPNSGTPQLSSNGRNHLPPLPSRRELEQRENDRLFEKQLRRHWRQVQDDEKLNKSSDGHPDQELTTPTTPSTPASHGQYKLLPVGAVPVLKVHHTTAEAPPLPPKSDLGRKRGFERPKVIHEDYAGKGGRKDVPVHYKALSDEVHELTYDPPPAPPLPPRRYHLSENGSRTSPAEERPSAIDGYKKLPYGFDSPAVAHPKTNGMESGDSKYQNNVCHTPKHNKAFAVYNRLPDPVPIVRPKQVDESSARHSLETEV